MSAAEHNCEIDRIVWEREDEEATSGEMITVSTYILKRLEQLGVTKMFGVPGDFNLAFLDIVEDYPAIDWVGNCNELNASHASDGYARVREGLGVFLTTYGVGELSALNGQAGAYCEHVASLHIVGVPNTTQIKNRPFMHHTMGDGRYNLYAKAAEQFAVAEAKLLNPRTAAGEIDRVLTAAIVNSRPGYLAIPTDIVYAKIPSGRLKTPLNHLPPANNPDTEQFVIDEIVRNVKESDGDVVILVDGCAIRHYVRAEVDKLITTTQFPVYAAPMGKTAVSEEYERYGGVYAGSVSSPEVLEKVENAKLVISIGSILSDLNTANFSYKIATTRTVELHSDHTVVQFAKFQGIGMKHLLPKLTAALEEFKFDAKEISVPSFSVDVPNEPGQDITHTWLWPRVSKFFKSEDVIIGETGTASFGLIDIPFPTGAIFVSQITFGSIGWTVGATLGAALAARERGLKGRTILFIGDGSLQLTVQEFGPMLRLGLNPIIFVLNNRGYTIERCIHGRTRKYNDVDNWNYTQLLGAFGGKEGQTCQSYMIDTKDELDALLTNEDFLRADKAQLVEVAMDPFDAPRALEAQCNLVGKSNNYESH